MALFGSSWSGKSTFLVDVLLNVVYLHMNATDSIEEPIQVLMTESPDAEPLKRLSNETIKHPEGLNQKFVDVACKLNRKWGNQYQFVMAFDDCMSMRYKTFVSSLFLTKRNANISSIVSTQYPKLVGPDVRDNINRVCLFKFHGNKSVEAAVDIYLCQYLPRDWRKEQKYQFYEHWTRPAHGRCFVIDQLVGEIVFVDEKRRLFNFQEMVDEYEENFIFREK